jgi:hypothetical protein
MKIIQGAPLLCNFNNIFDRAVSVSPGTLLGTPRSALVLGYQSKTDSVQISGAGRQMYLHVNKEDNDDKKAVSWESITNITADKTLSLVDKHISKAGKLLERMKALAEAAKDKSLTDIDRISLQIEIGRFQHELDTETDRMELSRTGYFSLEFMDSATQSIESVLKQWHGNFEESDAYKMLQRASERIAKGEEWNVAEIATDIVKIEDGEVAYVRTDWEVVDDNTVPTVSDILKAKGRSVMDPKSAALSAKELDRDLARLAKRREGFVSFIEKNGMNQQGGDDSGSFVTSANALASSLQMFLGTLYRDMVQTTYGPTKDEEGNYVERIVDNRPVRTEPSPSIEAARIQTQLNGKPPVVIQPT